MNSNQSHMVIVNGKPYPIAYGKMRPKPGTTIVYKKYHTKVFKPKGLCSSNKKLGCYVDDYPLDKYIIKNSAKVIYYIQVDENLYAIRVQKALKD